MIFFRKYNLFSRKEYIKKKNYIEFSSNEILISTRSTELLSMWFIHRNVKFLLFERKIVTNEENN